MAEIDLRTTAGRESLQALAALLESRALRYEQQRDSRCVFTLAYATMTKQLADAFGTPSDLDWTWIAVLADAFGRRYLSALDAADAGGEPPPAWAHAFGTLRTARTSVLEDLLFSMTVHIVRDLPHALCDVGLEDDGRAHLREFHFVNDIMASSIDPMQTLVAKRYGPYTRWLDQFAEGFDEILTNYGIRMSRATAWYNANRLLDMRFAEEAAQSIERSPRIFIETAMNPPWFSLALLLRVSRRISAFFRRWPTASSR